MKQNPPLKPVVSHVDDATLVVAASESFVAFDEWMDVQLAQLVAKWAHTAAPNAHRAQLLQGRFTKS
jgi:hypothetical protein